MINQISNPVINGIKLTAGEAEILLTMERLRLTGEISGQKHYDYVAALEAYLEATKAARR